MYERSANGLALPQEFVAVAPAAGSHSEANTISVLQVPRQIEMGQTRPRGVAVPRAISLVPREVPQRFSRPLKFRVTRVDYILKNKMLHHGEHHHRTPCIHVLLEILQLY